MVRCETITTSVATEKGKSNDQFSMVPDRLHRRRDGAGGSVSMCGIE